MFCRVKGVIQSIQGSVCVCVYVCEKGKRKIITRGGGLKVVGEELRVESNEEVMEKKNEKERKKKKRKNVVVV